MESSPILRPMPIWLSLLLFGIPSLVATLGIYWAIPTFDKAGLPLLVNFFLFTAGPMVLMLLSALIAYRLEGRPFKWEEIKSRFRIKPIRGREWFWTLGLAVVLIGGYLTLLPTARWLASFPAFAPPPFIPPIVDPRVASAGIPTELLGVQLEGRWWIVGLYFLVLCFNIYGEEFWWRGYILPRQELQHGKWTWLIHGILWNLFHVFWKWNLIALLPQTLSLSFVVYKTKNTTHGIIVHWINNGLGLVLILLGVLGLG